ncbi:glutamate receptor 2.8-like [Dorcoceras hygrometricum]|uniref:Glutamate receptor n=1 Tax=Dorcoceras hygrometricum TaxID=472368 RepID=A0A2Z7AXW9_9LAMI|nr:glutamate receptor 2.8-like [Dorcoceras hygrometricum]
MDSLLFPFLVALVMLPFRAAQSSSNDSTVDFHVGIILDLNSSVGRVGRSCISMAFSDFYSVHKDYKTRLVLHFRDSNESVVDAAAAALDLLRNVRVDAIIGPQNSAQVDFVMNLGDRAHVPVVSFSATSPSLVHRAPLFVQTSQSDAYQVQAIASIIQAFKWNQVVVINEDTDYGNGIIPDLSNALNGVNARISYRSVVPKSATDDFISQELYKMMGMQTRVFVVHASPSLGTSLFLKSKELGMISAGYAWIVTSGLTDLFHLMDYEVVESMQGLLGVKPQVPNSKQLRSFSGRWIRTFLREYPDMKVSDETSVFGLWGYDTLWALAMAAETVGRTKSNVVKNKNGDNAANPFALESSDTGPKLHDALLETRFPGLAGEFKLVNGQLEQTPYQIVNFDGNHEIQVAAWSPYVKSNHKGNLNETNSNFTPKVKFRDITWPGHTTVVPKGWEIPVNGQNLRVGVPRKPGFNEFLKVEIDPTTKSVKVSGYHKQVFESVMAALPYAVIPKYVPYEFLNANGSAAGDYDSLVYQVSKQEQFEAAMGDITITYDRSLNADFTLPYAEGGVSCIVPIINEDPTNEFTIFTLLSKQLWMTAVVFYLANTLAIWILGSRILSNAREPPGQHPGMICYFPCFPGENISLFSSTPQSDFSTLSCDERFILNVGQGLDANLLCLILVAWSSVSCLMNSTLTASLSSTLVVRSLRPAVTHVDQLIAKKYPVGCQEGSFLFDFMVKLGFLESYIRNYSSTKDCEDDLSLGTENGGIAAYCDVVPHIRLLLSQTCDKYVAIEPTYRTEGFAFAFPRGSPMVSDVSRAITKLIGDQTIQDIENQWHTNVTCLVQDSSPGSPTKIKVKTFVVLFVFSGFVTLVCLLVSELFDLHKKGVLLQKISGFKANLSSRIHHGALKLSKLKLVLIPQKQEVELQAVQEVGVRALETAAQP